MWITRQLHRSPRAGMKWLSDEERRAELPTKLPDVSVGAIEPVRVCVVLFSLE